MPEEVLTLRDVAVSFGTGRGVVRAVRQASARFERGQLSLIMGPSGSGKTTLLSVLGCLLNPDRGEVEIMGRHVTRLSQAELASVRRDSIGFVFQAFRLFRSLSALENVMMALAVAGRRHNARAKAKDLLDSLGMAHQGQASVGDLSGGEKQRVALARALANDPPIILADELTSSLDSIAGQQVAGLLRACTRQGRVAIVVTHDARLISYADRVLTMEDGILLSRKGGI